MIGLGPPRDQEPEMVPVVAHAYLLDSTRDEAYVAPGHGGLYIVHTALDDYRKHESRFRVPKAVAMSYPIAVIVVSIMGSMSLSRQDYEVQRRYLGAVSPNTMLPVGLRVKIRPRCARLKSTACAGIVQVHRLIDISPPGGNDWSGRTACEHFIYCGAN